MLGISRFVLFAVLLCLAGSPALCADTELQRRVRIRVENSIAFLTETGDLASIEAAKKLRNMLDDGKIVIGVPRNDDDVASGGWTENGIIFLNERTIGSPLPYNQITWEGTPGNRGNWLYAFTIAQTLVHELVHVEQGQDYVNRAGGLGNWIATGGNQAEVEGWRVGLTSPTRWLRLLEARLQGLPLSMRAEFAKRLADAASETRASVEGSLRYLSRGGDFSELGWQSPEGRIFLTQEEGMQYLLDYENRFLKIEAETLAELDKRRQSLSGASQAVPPQGFLGDGKGSWFCCQWMHPAFNKQTCAPGRNEALCKSYPQGKAVKNADCTDVQPGVTGCKPR